MPQTKKYVIYGVIAVIIVFIFSFETDDISKIAPAIREGCTKTELYVLHENSDLTHEVYDCTKLPKKDLN